MKPVWGRWTCPTRQLRATTISPSFKQFPFIFAIDLFNLVCDNAQAMLLSIVNLSPYQPPLTLQVPEKLNCKRKSSGTRNQFEYLIKGTQIDFELGKYFWSAPINLATPPAQLELLLGLLLDAVHAQRERLRGHLVTLTYFVLIFLCDSLSLFDMNMFPFTFWARFSETVSLSILNQKNFYSCFLSVSLSQSSSHQLALPQFHNSVCSGLPNYSLILLLLDVAVLPPCKSKHGLPATTLWSSPDQCRSFTCAHLEIFG